jgi:hypothetical protein
MHSLPERPTRYCASIVCLTSGSRNAKWPNRPGALADTGTAVASIIEQTERNDASAMVCVTRAIEGQVVNALEAKFPKRMIISHPIQAPGQSLRERGQLDERPELEPSRDEGALDRVRERASERDPTHWSG